MAALSRSNTKAQYSWWWDSHISPKNSKWLKENLTDMDSKVKTMIKLIEVDEDSFVRRAEVYFRRRPELMKLVEEFYRAYRALAERYDHATGIIRDAQQTMSEAFPDQVPSLMSDDFDPHTPEMKASDFSSVKENREVETLAGRKARKGLNFQEVESETGVGMKKNDLQALKDALAKLEAEKEDGLLQYQQAIGKLSKLESEVSQAKEDSRGLNERASKAEAEVESLKETILRVETEREDSLIQYQLCLSRILNFEKETGVLMDELTQVKAEKEALLAKYLESLEKIASLENKLLLAEDYASRTSEQAERAEKQIENLKETIARLSEEKEASVRKYEECLEKISSLQSEIAAIQKELSEKDEELRKLWTCVEEERMRFTEAENSFQSLQNVHSEVQKELRLVATELQKKVELLKDMEIQNQHLQDEVQKALDENKSLYEVNLSSAVTITSMQGDINGLKDQKGKLEKNLELQVDEHSKLKESSEKNEAEIASLVEKLAIMEKLMEKNELLENSLADLEAELDAAREKMKALEESKSMLASDKTTLISQLEMTTMNVEELSERNSFLENSLFDVNGELEMLRVKSKNLEDSCRLLVTEKQTLASQLEITQSKFEDLGKRHADLEKRYIGLEEERESTLHRVEELRGFLEVEKQERDNSSQLNQTKISSLESEICVLQEVGEHVRNEFEEELDKAVNAQFDIFILRNSIHDLKDKNTSLMGYCEKLQEASKLSEKLIFELENTSYEQKEELRLLSGEIKGLRKGMFQLLEALQFQSYTSPKDNDSYETEDQRILHYIIVKLDDIKTSLCEAMDENHALIIEKSVLLAVLWQLKRDVEDLNDVIIFLRQEIEIRNNHILVLQKEMHTLLESNEELILKVREGNQKEATLLTEIQSLRGKLFNLQGAYNDLKQEKHGLEDECSCLVGEAVALDNLSVIFKNIVSEKAREFIELNENYEKLGYENRVLVEKVRVLSSELQQGKDTVELWETLAWTLFSELQSADVRETLIKEKLYELMRYYKILEEENCSKGTDIVELHKRVGVLEGEDSEIKARLAADFSAILSLKYSVASLEKHTGLQRKPHETNEEQKEEDQQLYYDLSEDKAIAGNVDLHDVRERIQAVEKAVIELKQHKEERYSRTLSRHGSKRFSKRFGLNSDEISRSGPQVDGAERGDELLMKDIVLDQVSDPSSDGKKKSTRKMVSDDLELWETVDGGGSIDLSVGKPEKYVKDNMSSRPSSVLTAEKEFLWINDEQRLSSKRFPRPEGDNKRKFLERLASDVQKLTNLQITVQDLKEKVDIDKSAECDGIKDQLVETENNILNLFNYGEKLMKRIEKSTSFNAMSSTSFNAMSSMSFNAASSTDSISEGGSGRRRRCSEQAQRISEKIGRLQLQVQKIQFSLLKYDRNKVGGKSGPKAPELNTRVLLRDYLYGRGPRTPKRRLKTRLCACIRPSTMED